MCILNEIIGFCSKKYNHSKQYEADYYCTNMKDGAEKFKPTGKYFLPNSIKVSNHFFAQFPTHAERFGSVQNGVKTLIPHPLLASLAAWPKEKLLLTLFLRTGRKGPKWAKGLKKIRLHHIGMTPNSLLAIFNPYGQSVGSKLEVVFLSAGRPNWLIVAVESKFLCSFSTPESFLIENVRQSLQGPSCK